MNEKRIEAGRAAIEAYAAHTGISIDEAHTDCLTDVMHFIKQELLDTESDPQEALEGMVRSAFTHLEAEEQEAGEDTAPGM